jgi:hypothetical protein
VCDRDPFPAGLFFQLVIQIEAHLGEFGGSHGCPECFAIEQFVSEFDGDVGHDEAYSGEVEFAVAVMAEELHPDLMNKGKDGVVTDVAAVVEVRYTDRDLRDEGETGWQGEFGS